MKDYVDEVVKAEIFLDVLLKVGGAREVLRQHGEEVLLPVVLTYLLRDPHETDAGLSRIAKSYVAPVPEVVPASDGREHRMNYESSM